MGKNQSLQYQRKKEIQEGALIVILGALILSCWFILGTNLLKTPRLVLGFLSSSVAANAIYMILIPYSINSVLVRWLDIFKQLCVTNWLIYKEELEEISETKTPSNQISLIRNKNPKRFFLLSYAITALFTTLLLLLLAYFSGFIGIKQTGEPNDLAFLFSIVVFNIYTYRTFSIAIKLVKIILKELE